MSGKSGQANINACILDILHEPYNSTMDPLDLLFNGLPQGGTIPPFSMGYSIGMTKGVAAIAITYAVVKLKLEHSEMQTIQAELVALLAMRATCDPAADIEAQVNRSISRKIRASERPRPQVLQLHFAFERAMRSKKAKGDRRQDTALLGAIMETYNSSQASKNKLTCDERECCALPAWTDTDHQE